MDTLWSLIPAETVPLFLIYKLLHHLHVLKVKKQQEWAVVYMFTQAAPSELNHKTLSDHLDPSADAVVPPPNCGWHCALFAAVYHSLANERRRVCGKVGRKNKFFK